MVCGGCVQKLALKLLRHHKHLDWIRALELAEKGVERVEKRKVKAGILGKDDYTQDCVGSNPPYCGIQTCRPREPLGCLVASACTGTCNCPEPSDPNSHLVRDGCDCEDCCLNYNITNCPEGCNCHCTGTCGYDCDIDYTWNAETQTCDLAVPSGGILVQIM